MELTEKQIIKLFEENLTNKLYYHYDEIKQEKRPFGNSGYGQIFKDIKEILKINKKFEAEDEDELSNLIYDWVDSIFKQMEEWAKNNSEKFEVKIVKLED